MKKSRILLIFCTLIISLFAIVALISYLSRSGIITPEMALLMLVALLGFYVGFGVLVVAYRFVCRMK